VFNKIFTILCLVLMLVFQYYDQTTSTVIFGALFVGGKIDILEDKLRKEGLLKYE
jgi:hypothetical protein